MLFSKSDIENLNYITEDATSYITIYHDEVVKIFNNIDTNLKSEITIINFDQHSDIHLNIPHQTLSYANWVNFLLLQNQIKDFFWYFPKSNIKKYKKFKPKFDIGPLIPNLNHLKEGNLQYKFFLDRKNFEIITPKKIKVLNENAIEFEMPKFYDKEKLEQYNINISTFDNKKSFLNKKIFLTIDADFFSIRNEKVKKQIYLHKYLLYKSFSDFLKYLKTNYIKPIYIVMTYSPNYINDYDKKDISYFFDMILKRSLKI